MKVESNIYINMINHNMRFLDLIIIIFNIFIRINYLHFTLLTNLIFTCTNNLSLLIIDRLN